MTGSREQHRGGPHRALGRAAAGCVAALVAALAAGCAGQPTPTEQAPTEQAPAAASASAHGLTIQAHDGCRITEVTPVDRDAQTPVGVTPAQLLERVARTYQEPWTWQTAERPATEATLDIAPRDRQPLVVREEAVGFDDGREEGISCEPLRLFVPVTIVLATADGHLRLAPFDAWLFTTDGAAAALDAHELSDPAQPDTTRALSLMVGDGGVRGVLIETRVSQGTGVVGQQAIPVGHLGADAQ